MSGRMQAIESDTFRPRSRTRERPRNQNFLSDEGLGRRILYSVIACGTTRR